MKNYITPESPETLENDTPSDEAVSISAHKYAARLLEKAKPKSYGWNISVHDAVEYLTQALSYETGGNNLESCIRNARGSLACEIMARLAQQAIVCYNNKANPLDFFSPGFFENYNKQTGYGLVPPERIFADVAAVLADNAVAVAERGGVRSDILATVYGIRSAIAAAPGIESDIWRSDYLKVCKLDDSPQKTIALGVYAGIFEQAGDFDAAIKILKYNAEYGFGFTAEQAKRLTILCSYTGKWADAVKYCTDYTKKVFSYAVNTADGNKINKFLEEFVDGLVYYNQSNHADAFLQDLVSRGKASIALKRRYADICTAHGDLGEATEVYRNIFNMTEDDAHLLVKISKITLNEACPGVVLEDATNFIDFYKETSLPNEIYDVLGQAYIACRRFDEAVETFKTPLERNNSDVTAMNLCAFAEIFRGNRNRALELCENALVNDPGNRFTNLMCAYLHNGLTPSVNCIKLVGQFDHSKVNILRNDNTASFFAPSEDFLSVLERGLERNLPDEASYSEEEIPFKWAKPSTQELPDRASLSEDIIDMPKLPDNVGFRRIDNKGSNKKQAAKNPDCASFSELSESLSEPSETNKFRMISRRTFKQSENSTENSKEGSSGKSSPSSKH